MPSEPAPQTPARRTPERRGTPPGRGVTVGGHGGRIGNPAFVATEEQRARVRGLAQAFPVQAEHLIARLMGFSLATLQKHFRDDMEMGRAQMLAEIGTQMIRRAIQGNDAVDAEGKPLIKGDLEAQKFVLARLAGWTTKVDLRPVRAAPSEIVDLSRLTREQLDDYGRLAAIAEGLDPEDVIGADGGD